MVVRDPNGTLWKMALWQICGKPAAKTTTPIPTISSEMVKNLGSEPKNRISGLRSAGQTVSKVGVFEIWRGSLKNWLNFWNLFTYRSTNFRFRPQVGTCLTISEEMVAIGVVVLAAGLTQICHRAIFHKVQFGSRTTIPYVIVYKIRTIADWKGLDPDLQTRGVG